MPLPCGCCQSRFEIRVGEFTHGRTYLTSLSGIGRFAVFGFSPAMAPRGLRSQDADFADCCNRTDRRLRRLRVRVEASLKPLKPLSLVRLEVQKGDFPRRGTLTVDLLFCLASFEHIILMMSLSFRSREVAI